MRTRRSQTPRDSNVSPTEKKRTAGALSSA